MQIVQEAGLDGVHREGIIDHFLTEVLTTASNLQPRQSVDASHDMLQMSKQDILTTFITELIQSISTATKEEVIIIDTLLIKYDQFIVIPTVGSHIYTAFHNISKEKGNRNQAGQGPKSFSCNQV